MKDFRLLTTKLRKSKKLKIALLFLPFPLVLLLVVLVGAYSSMDGSNKEQSLLSPPIKNFQLSQYPIQVKEADVNISAQAGIILDDESKVVLYKKNETLRFSIASTTKIMTALIGLEYYKPEDVLTVKTNRVEPVVVGFGIGEQIYFKDILYALLLASGNDAAAVIAQNYPGGQEAFVERMNQKALQYNLIDTHYTDPSGLDTKDYSTALDLARLASIAMQNKTFSTVVATKQKEITNVSKNKTYSLSNLNTLLGKYGVNGVKTGFTEEAGGVLVASTNESGRRIITVVIKSEDRILDTQLLLSKISGNINFLPIHP